MGKELRRKDLFTKEFRKFSYNEAVAIDGINYLKKFDLSSVELINERNNLSKQFMIQKTEVLYSDIYWRLLNKRNLQYLCSDTDRYSWNRIAMANFSYIEGKNKNAVNILMTSYKTLLMKENIHASMMDFESEFLLEMNALEDEQDIYLHLIISTLHELNKKIGHNFVLNDISKRYSEFFLEIKNKFKELNRINYK